MEEDRLPTALWVEAQLRRLTVDGRPYYLVNRGAYASGTLLIKIDGLNGSCLLLQQQRGVDGTMGWMAVFSEGTVDREKADGYISRSLARDPDLWVVEVEDRELKNPFEGATF